MQLGMIKGIGPIYARKLVRAFSEQVFDVIEQTPERLQEVDGIGPKRAESIVAAWVDQKAIREIMIFLHGHSVGTSRAVRIFKTYGADAIRVISENPYRLARDIRGIGFKSADLIADKLGIEKTAMIRARADIGYALAEAMDEGHCGLPREQLLTMAAKLLEVPAAIIEGALEMELQDGEVVADTVDERPCNFSRRAASGRACCSCRSRPRRWWPTLRMACCVAWPLRWIRRRARSRRRRPRNDSRRRQSRSRARSPADRRAAPTGRIRRRRCREHRRSPAA